jgi:hypothetical protein
VIPDLIQLPRREAWVGDDRPGLDAACREQEAGQRDAILAHDHDAVAAPDAQSAERIRRPSHRSVELAIAQTAAIIDHGQAFRQSLKLVIRDVVQP